MNKFGLAGAALLASTAIVNAGGLERSAFTTGILFEEGTYAELSYGSISPSVSGNFPGTPFAGSSGDMTPTYALTTLSIHHDINEQLSFSLVVDQPIGANVDFTGALGLGAHPFNTTYADLTSRQITAAVRYEMANNVSVYGGLRAVQAAGDVYVNATSGFAYALDAESDTGFGYMVGAAYERPDIALRVALTYFSEVDLAFSGIESPFPPAAPNTPEAVLLAAATATSFNNTLPQSVLLEAQSGIAANTLLMGSIRWTNWDGYSIMPNRYPGVTLVNYTDDVWTYNLGIAHRLNENWAISASLGYEASQGGLSGNLGPTDGFTSISLGAQYTIDAITISGGVRYVMIGDANTGYGGATSTYADNDAVALGLSIGYQF